MKKGLILHYYTIFVDGKIAYAKIQLNRDSDSELLSLWTILEKVGYIGGEYSVGGTISANQLQGVGVKGLKAYTYKNEEDVLKQFFKDYAKFDI